MFPTWRAKRWYASAFGVGPYFDGPFYVGFNIGGYELGLDPSPGGTTAGPGRERGLLGRVERRCGTVADPFGNLISLIENRHFAT